VIENLSERLLTTSGVRQGCVLAPALFCVAIDWILRHMKDKPGIEVGCEHFSDLVYADNTAFLVNTTSDAVSSLSSFQDTASALGLRISWPKTKLQNLGAGHQPPSVLVDSNTVDSVDSFVYLGSLLSSDGHCRPLSQISIDASAWPHELCLLCATSGRTDICLLAQKSVSTRLLSSQSYYMQQKPGLLLPLTSKLLKPSA